MRQIEDALRHPDSPKEDIITVFLALQKQCFILGNSLTNLVKNWPKPTTVQNVKYDLDEFIRPEK